MKLKIGTICGGKAFQILSIEYPRSTSFDILTPDDWRLHMDTNFNQ